MRRDQFPERLPDEVCLCIMLRPKQHPLALALTKSGEVRATRPGCVGWWRYYGNNPWKKEHHVHTNQCR